MNNNSHPTQSYSSVSGYPLFSQSRTSRPNDRSGNRSADSRAKSREGLVLLIVLGMLALFSLLAVSFVVFSQNSRDASIAIERSEARRIDYRRLADSAVMSMIRGDVAAVDNAYAGHSFFEDMYSRDSIATPVLLIDPALHVDGEDNVIQVQGDDAGGTPVSSPFLKIPLPRHPSNQVNNQSPFFLPLADDALTGRLVTFTGGPLADHTFRILKYFGGETQHPSTGSPTLEYLNYSIVISLADVRDNTLTTELSTGETVTRSIADWVGSPNSLCYEAGDYRDLRTYTDRYSMVINGALFNGSGQGLVENPVRQPYYGGGGQSWIQSTQTLAKLHSLIPSQAIYYSRQLPIPTQQRASRYSIYTVIFMSSTVLGMN